MVSTSAQPKKVHGLNSSLSTSISTYTSCLSTQAPGISKNSRVSESAILTKNHLHKTLTSEQIVNLSTDYLEIDDLLLTQTGQLHDTRKETD